MISKKLTEKIQFNLANFKLKLLMNLEFFSSHIQLKKYRIRFLALILGFKFFLQLLV